MEFVCQRCGKILEIDESLMHIDFSLLDKGEVDLDKIITSHAPRPTTPPSQTTSQPTTPSSEPIQHKRNDIRSESPTKRIATSGSFITPHSKVVIQQTQNTRAISYIEPPAVSTRQQREKYMTQKPKFKSPIMTTRTMSTDSVLDHHQSDALDSSIDPSTSHGNSTGKFLDRRGTVAALKYVRQPSKLNLNTTTPPQKEREKEKEALAPSDEALASRLFQVASEQTGVDLPLCSECSKTLATEIDEELSMLEAQQLSYSSFYEQLEQKEKKWSESHEDVESEIQRMEEEERLLREQLVACDLQREAQQQELDYLKGEADVLTSFEDRYWQHFDELHVQLSSFLDERDAVRVQTAVLTETLELLKKTQIINDAFHIWHDGHFGTINTFRLGRLPSQPVDWNEINAAWGLAVLLLANMAKKIGFTFSMYKLVPCGSCSKMERTDNSSSYELFGSSDISLGRLFWYRRFDNGMVAFLVCLKEMGDYAEARDKTFRLPYKMEKDKIGDMSIKIQFNNEETWTKGLKYMLTNLKWLLAWIVKTEVEQNITNIGGPNGVMLTSAPHNNSNNNTNNSNTSNNSSNTSVRLSMNRGRT